MTWLSRRIELPLPTPTQRAALLSSFLSTNSTSLTSSSSSLDHTIRTIAYRSAGFLPRDLERLASLAQSLAQGKEVAPEHLAAARMQLPPSQLADHLPALPAVTWNDVGGSETIRKAFEEAFEWPTLHGDALSRMGVVPPSGTR